ncbi:MAG: ABC transporter ATP-binding protein [Anaerolineaceae bacterium]
MLALFSLVQGIIPAIQLWISKLLIDSIVNLLSSNVDGQWVKSVSVFIIYQACLTFISSSINTIQTTTFTLLGDLLSNQINLRILQKTNKLDLSFFENAKFYDKMQNAFQQASNRPLGIVTQLFSFFQTLITLLSIIYLLLQLNWIILPLIIFTSLPMMMTQKKYGEQNYWKLRERTPELRKHSYLNAILTNDRYIKDVRIYHLENYFVNKSQTLFKKFFTENRNFVIKQSLALIYSSIPSIIGWLISASYIIIQATKKLITVGDFSLYLQAISTAQSRILSLINVSSSLYSDILFIRNLFEFLDLPIKDLSGGKKFNENIEELEFRNVIFRYPYTNQIVLEDINFKIKKGQSLAIVGRNGAGKTTLIKLLCRLYEPTAGEILINGNRLSEYSPESIQEKISVLFQDFAIYFLTARENIGVGDVSKINDLSSIRDAAHKGGADFLIESLTEKYETNLGRWFDGGVNLSGGEWQKIALSRIYMRQSDLFILDEPTSALDAEAEFETFRQILKDKVNKITFLISHRFSTVRVADHILVLERGKQIEYGTHESLMRLGGQYANLYNIQAKGFR